jgi:glutamate/tyrosine decarboxylase-like PLP-dependent enzyme
MRASIQTGWGKSFDAFHRGPKALARLQPSGTGVPEAWFLGPKAENEYLLLELVVEAICSHCDFRRQFHPEDPTFITKELKKSKAYTDAVEKLRQHASVLFNRMQQSVPFFSMRYQSHMLWDQALPAMVGYFGAMLYNQNDVAAEASPVTTQIEIEVGNALCKMLGFTVPWEDVQPANWEDIPPGTIVPWGHITCDGTVANIEGLWAARNAKFFALALREALRHESTLAAARSLEVKLLDGSSGARLAEIDDVWVLVNLRVDDVVNLPQKIQDAYGIAPSITNAALEPYALQNIGMLEFYKRFMSDLPTPVVFVPTVRHYSWPKAGALLGLGQNNVKKIHVDLQARMDVGMLTDALNDCLKNRQPVIAVVAVIGSTEESAVDPLRKILDTREHFRRRGLDFAIHCDAAWGGYFNSMRVRPPQESSISTTSTPALTLAPEPEQAAQMQRLMFLQEFARLAAQVPEFPMSAHVNEQYDAMCETDSITVDPHKAGYVPYPAGAICYRNSALRSLISLRAPVIFHNDSEPTVGIYGVEGSKPGAAAAAVWLAHQVIPLNQNGCGKILAQCMWTSTRLYCRLVTMADRDPQARYKIVVFQMLPAEREGSNQAAIDAQREYIRQNFVYPNNQELLDFLNGNPDARALFGNLGSDQVILAYSFNFKDKKSGEWNRDVEKLNKLNDEIFNICSVRDPNTDVKSKKLILTSSAFDVGSYGRVFVDKYCQRLGVDNANGVPISFLISTTMDPWTTDTPNGDFLAVVEDALRAAVNQALELLDF